MVQLRNRRVLIDDKPVIVLSGEVHYFRLKRNEWEDRLDKAVACGCNAIASYIPWLIHEPTEGEFDLDGHTRPENDLGAFIDLCAARGLWFIARPGPFIMAEMKNEGIPYWVYTKHPDAIPVTWNGERARSKTLDYLNTGFLGACERWYGAVMPILAKRLQPKGGPIIAVQLDNEVGMLSWVNNQPDLNDDLLCDFSGWLVTRYDDHALAARYPFDVRDPVERAKAFRSPEDSYALRFHRDYGDYNRSRFARYFAALRGFAEQRGVVGVPFVINIHGTGGGNGRTFPIGIHQLSEAYTQADGWMTGSDHYFGELDRSNFQDLYMINAMMQATHRPEQPLTSMEFEVGTGDYGETGGVRQSGASADMKIKLSIAQGNRLLNYYLLTGGVNPPLAHPVGDGNDRVAFTGERHGFAAPISPEGQPNETYWALTQSNQSVRAVAHLLADMEEELDGVWLGFVPSYYKTDFTRPGPMRDMVANLEWIRGPLQTLTRAMLFAGYRFGAVDVERKDLDPATTPGVAVVLAQYADAALQDKLARYVERGGHLFAFGDFPAMDMEGNPCRILADAFGLEPDQRLEANSGFHLSVKGVNRSQGPEVRVSRAQTFRECDGALVRVVGTNAPCGVERKFGKGRAYFLPCDYPCHVNTFAFVLAGFGLTPRWWPHDSEHGILVTSMRNTNGEGFICLINLDHEAKHTSISYDHYPVLGHSVTIPARSARLLPFRVTIEGMHIAVSNFEIVAIHPGAIHFRGEPGMGAIFVVCNGPLTVEGATAHRLEGNGWLVSGDFRAEEIVVRRT